MKLPTGIGGWLKATLPWVLLAVLLLLPATHPSDNLIRLLFITAVWTTTSLGWNLLGGMAGQVSFGFAVFFGLGAYTTALLMHVGHSPYFGFAGGAAIAMLASFFIGLPTFRLRRPYFVIATIGLTAVIISTIIAKSKFGLALRAIKQDEDAAAHVGVNPYTSKLWIHAIAAGLTGIAGGIYARRAAFIYPGDVFAFQTGISILLMPVIGGIGTIWGAVLGGVIFGMVEEQISVKFPNLHLLIYGSLLILIILLEPDGLLGLLRRLFQLFRSKREDSGSPDADQVLWGRGGVEGR